MNFCFIILLFVTCVVSTDQVIQLFCEGTDSVSTCMIGGFEQTDCGNFGSPVGCNASQQNCRGCETRDVIGRGMYKSSIDAWCKNKGGNPVTVSTLRDCNA